MRCERKHEKDLGDGPVSQAQKAMKKMLIRWRILELVRAMRALSEDQLFYFISGKRLPHEDSSFPIGPTR